MLDSSKSIRLTIYQLLFHKNRNYYICIGIGIIHSNITIYVCSWRRCRTAARRLPYPECQDASLFILLLGVSVVLVLLALVVLLIVVWLSLLVLLHICYLFIMILLSLLLLVLDGPAQGLMRQFLPWGGRSRGGCKRGVCFRAHFAEWLRLIDKWFWPSSPMTTSFILIYT